MNNLRCFFFKAKIASKAIFSILITLKFYLRQILNFLLTNTFLTNLKSLLFETKNFEAIFNDEIETLNESFVKINSNVELRKLLILY